MIAPHEAFEDYEFAEAGEAPTLGPPKARAVAVESVTPPRPALPNDAPNQEPTQARRPASGFALPAMIADHESRFIAAVLIDATLDRLNENRGLQIAAFDDYRHRHTWAQLRKAETLDEVESIAMSYAAVETGSGMHFHADRMKLYFRALEVIGLSRVDEWRRSLPSGMKGDPLAAMDARRLDLTAPPPRPAPVLTCAGVPVAKRGDITAVIAPAKAGKSAWIGAAIAAAVVSGEGVTNEADCLGIVAGVRPENSVVLLLDTEQSEADQFDLAHRAARRAGVEVLPDWVMPYNLVGAAPSEIRPMLTAKLVDLKAHGVPVWFVVIDGVADLCDDPNDLGESQELVREVHDHAREADCPIIAVIHRNEGRDADQSARGHLGKQLARKAAFNLTLEKDSNEVTVVFSSGKNRGAPILKKNGPRFAWSDELNMHASVATPSAGHDVEELRELAKDVFVKDDQLTNGELHESIMEVSGKKKTWANDRIKELKLNDIIRASGGGKYMMVQSI
ncbi:MAG: AAA family ATPase [Opitutus sp.]|nr:AAA family ATPase [Opitutus sp.]MCS6246254.1 AAA family ATPase [Opitutus sp.]MCS6274119.1 AAA family ATPase [Opitutus sp.]MCS6277261.1 AAA family ATPase [Opitutus sp.]MCS6300383.1 AAA family ATPase [Opitutus sp.]